MPGDEKPKVFIDADVLVAGSASSTGASHLLLKLAEFGLVEAISSEQARKEAERNIRAKLPEALPAFRLLVREACRWVRDPPRDAVLRFEGQAHEKDAPILAAAVAHGCSSLIAFNVRHFKPARGTIRIETPGRFIARLRTILTHLED